jgi:hypothetical protein
MTVDQISTSTWPRRLSIGDTLLDGLFSGAIGALAVAMWFLIIDVLAGRPLFTPALLGTVLLHGGAAAAQGVTVAPLEVAAYTAVHFVAFLAVGVFVSWLMAMFERFAIVGFVMLVLFACFQVGFFALDAALGLRLTGQIQPWSIIIANILASAAMALFLWKRHPHIRETLSHAWDEEP